MTTWKFISTFVDGMPFEFVPGHNIWDYEWHQVKRDPPPALTGDYFKDHHAQHEFVRVIDPYYGSEREFAVYEATVAGRTIRFAASEFSNNVWGYYVPEGG